VVDWNRVVELGAVLVAPQIVHPAQGDVTVFKSLGLGIADVALAGLLTARMA
jgi:ornithine cyclodeaminase